MNSSKTEVLETVSQTKKTSFGYYHRILKLAKKINTNPDFSKANLLKELEATLGPI